MEMEMEMEMEMIIVAAPILDAAAESLARPGFQHGTAADHEQQVEERADWATSEIDAPSLTDPKAADRHLVVGWSWLATMDWRCSTAVFDGAMRQEHERVSTE
jgi:hypothetical protein